STFAQVGAIKGFVGVFGVAADANGNVYVCDASGGKVYVYKPRGTVPIRTLSPAHSPQELRVATDGTVFVRDLSNYIEVFPKGRTTPSRLLSTTGAYRVAIDAKRNIYFGVSQGAMYEIRDPYRRQAIELPEQVSVPFSQSFDRNGNMLVADYYRGNNG